MLILETPRLFLRHQVPSDLEALWSLYQDPLLTRFIPDAPRSREEAREELEWHQHGHPHHPELGLWATVHRPTGEFMGRCGLLPWTIEGHAEVEVAYTIARRFWGQGLATEAAHGIVHYARTTLHLQRLICLIDPDNLASQRVAQKIGMTFEREAQDETGPFWIFSSGSIP